MQTTIKNLLLITTIAILNSCNTNNQSQSNNNATEIKTADAESKPNNQPELKGDYCFMKVENKDTTTVKLRFLSNDDIRGEMIWRPWEKDGAIGSLTGKLNTNNEIELMYNYVIEGSRQSETKIMKIENEKLYIKKGELEDKKYDGNLTYKDVSKAQYTEEINKIECK